MEKATEGAKELLGMIELHLPETQYMCQTTHRIPDGEDAQHFAINCHCKPTYAANNEEYPEGWHVYDPEGRQIPKSVGRVVTHRSMKQTNHKIDIPWE